jgi:hypothetical protein
MQIIKKVTKEVYEVYDVLCNKCGSTCFPNDAQEPYGLIEAEVIGGYFSTSLQDCMRYKFSLCEKCLKELFDSFIFKGEQYGNK